MRRTFLGWALAGLLVLAGWSAAAVFPTSTLWVDAGSKCNNPDGTLERPFKTINAALAHLPQTGGTLKVKSGVYREAVRLPSHCTLEAAPGAKVTISGMEPITGWRPIGQGVYEALVDWRPERLFVGLTEQPLAKLPKEGWWKVESAAGDVFTCPKAAQGLPEKLDRSLRLDPARQPVFYAAGGEFHQKYGPDQGAIDFTLGAIASGRQVLVPELASAYQQGGGMGGPGRRRAVCGVFQARRPGRPGVGASA